MGKYNKVETIICTEKLPSMVHLLYSFLPGVFHIYGKFMARKFRHMDDVLNGLCPFPYDRQNLVDDRARAIGLLKFLSQSFRYGHDRCGHALQCI